MTADVRPCPKGHLDRYANGECRVCAIERMRRNKARKRAAGVRTGVGISLPGDVADLVAARAKRKGISISSYARQLLLAGLEAVEGRRADAM